MAADAENISLTWLPFKPLVFYLKRLLSLPFPSIDTYGSKFVADELDDSAF